MAKRRRTSGIQRRERASSEALTRRLDADRGVALPDWRLLAIGGVLVIGAVLVVLVLLMGSAPNPNAGVAQPLSGGGHVTDGANCRSPSPPQECGTGQIYSSLPATSGPHWGTPANWGVYSTPQPETQLIHNLEHGGIVIWYDPDLVDAEGIGQLESYVESQVATGLGGRFKFIVSPWGGGEDLPTPVAVTSWRYLLELDALDLDAIRGFADANYLRHAPEPNGGPGP